MRLRVTFVSCAILLVFAACNEIPVTDLNESYSVQVQVLRDKGKPAKLDVLWVVDDSTSMCQEQQSLADSFKAFLKRNVMQYENYRESKVHFIGSVAFYYKTILAEAASEMGIRLGTVIKSPMEGLIEYHK